MKVLQINTVCGTGSTGRIVGDLYNALFERGHDSLIAYGRGTNAPRGSSVGDVKTYRIGDNLDTYYHVLMTRLTDKTGFYSTEATNKLINEITKYNPDIIHLHNIHGYYLNIELLFNYLAKLNTPIVWTLHDCWPFTGHCSYFDYADCDKWKTGCFNCPEKHNYPKSIFLDNSKWNYEQKLKLFTSLENITIVTPSKWLAGLVKESFLGKYDVQVINNGIDLSIFRPTISDFRKAHSLTDRFIILGVANNWDNRKGLNDFIKLSGSLDDSQKIVLVGLNKKQLKALPQNILGLGRTNSIRELAEIYSAADVYVNASVEETMGLTTVEALACGTPVVVYDATAIPECVDDTVGFKVEKNNISALLDAINIIKNDNPFNSDGCISKAKQYDKAKKYTEYLDLYDKLL